MQAARSAVEAAESYKKIEILTQMPAKGTPSLKRPIRFDSYDCGYAENKTAHRLLRVRNSLYKTIATHGCEKGSQRLSRTQFKHQHESVAQNIGRTATFT